MVNEHFQSFDQGHEILSSLLAAKTFCVYKEGIMGNERFFRGRALFITVVCTILYIILITPLLWAVM